MRARDLHRQPALCYADVDKRLVISPGELLCDRHGGTETNACHRAEKVFQSLRVGINRLEWIAASLGFVLRLSSAQTFRQRAPEWI